MRIAGGSPMYAVLSILLLLSSISFAQNLDPLDPSFCKGLKKRVAEIDKKCLKTEEKCETAVNNEIKKLAKSDENTEIARDARMWLIDHGDWRYWPHKEKLKACEGKTALIGECATDRKMVEGAQEVCPY